MKYYVNFMEHGGQSTGGWWLGLRSLLNDLRCAKEKQEVEHTRNREKVRDER